MKQPAFIGPSYILPSLNVDCQRSVNLYLKINELGTGKNQEVASLVSVPGLKTIYSGDAHALSLGKYLASNGQAFAVLGGTLYGLSNLGIPQTTYGSIPGTGKVGMADNGIHLCIVNGYRGYLLTLLGNDLMAIADPNFPNG